MADCSRAEVFFAEWERMHKHYENEQCAGCPVRALAHAIGEKDCIKAVFNMPKELVIGAVQRWSDEHPEPKPKTYADIFFENFPTASKDDACIPFICRKHIFGTGYGGCNWAGYDCRACWNEPYPEQEAPNE